jgi:catalase
MTPQQAKEYKWNVLDVTKVWPHADFPLVPIGKLTLNRNPDNYFQDTEQAAFSPSHLVPGIEPSNDKMLQGRLFSYPDTHRHRLGPNYQQLPVNRPRACPYANQQRDGPMCVDGNQGAAPNYEPHSLSTTKVFKVVSSRTPGSGKNDKDKGVADFNRFIVPLTPDDFVQAGNLYRLQPPGAKARLVSNVVQHLSQAKPHIRRRQVSHFATSDRQLGAAIDKVITPVFNY